MPKIQIRHCRTLLGLRHMPALEHIQIFILTIDQSLPPVTSIGFLFFYALYSWYWMEATQNIFSGDRFDSYILSLIVFFISYEAQSNISNLSTVTAVSTHRTWYTHGILKKNIILVALNIKPLGVKYSGSSLGLLSRAPNEAPLITVYRGCNHHKVPRDCQACCWGPCTMHMISDRKS